MGRKNKRIERIPDKKFQKFTKNFMAEQQRKQERSYTQEDWNKKHFECAIEQLELNNIEYAIINEEKTFIECRRGNSNSWIKYYASSGYIMGYPDFRGINALIMLLKQEI